MVSVLATVRPAFDGFCLSIHWAAWPSGLGKGLQSPVHRFDSGRRLSALLPLYSQVREYFRFRRHVLAQTAPNLLKPLILYPGI